MSWFLVFPLMAPFATAVLSFLYRQRDSGRWIAVTGSLLAVLAALALMVQVLNQGVVVGQMGNWPAPYGITLAADRLSAMMVLLTAISGLAVSLYAAGEVDTTLEVLGFHSLMQILLGGVTGAFLTGDLFNLYVWFEVMLIASFGLQIMGGRPEQIDGAVKYVTLNLVSTVVFLSGIGLLYGVTGTLNMADLRSAVAASDRQGLIAVISMFFLIAFGMKAAAFPLFFWLPASYHTPTHTVSAVFAGLLTKVGVYSLFRVFTLIFDQDTGLAQPILLWVAGLTMVTGVLGAIAQTELRRILSYQIISSIGFLLLGLALSTPLAIAGAIFYLMHNIIVKVALFLTAGVMARLAGGEDLRRIGGLYKTAPALGVLFLITGFSLAGFPPLSGFWGKVLLVKASLASEAWILTAAVLVVGLLTIYSMTTIWAEAFWKNHPDDRDPALADLGDKRGVLLTPIVGLCVLSLGLGLFPQPFITFAEAAAAQLLAPDAYVAAVLGGSGP
ncbi:MAG: Na+/H+ antiporter subunit D [Rhodobacteraceae bacterium]|nr:Na+/H+ antiporter subunit D [Paracoccaceae bacterium]